MFISAALTFAIGASAAAIPLSVDIYNGAGERVRAYPHQTVANTITQFLLTYTSTGTCPVWTFDTAQPFSPDNDCHNDVIVFSFPELVHPITGGPYDVFRWDGKNDRGEWVRNGHYIALAKTTSTIFAAGGWITLQQTIMVAALRVEIIAHIYDAAGLLVYSFPAVANPGATQIKENQAIYTPDVAASNLSTFTLVNDAGVELGLLTWDGRDSRGRVVPNGRYMINILITAATGHQYVITRTFDVLHGEMDLINDLRVIPNPVMTSAERVWFQYLILAPNRLVRIKVNVHSVAGELVASFNAEGQPPPADPLDASGNGIGSIYWGLTNNRNQRIARGLYIVTVEAINSSGLSHRAKLKLAVN